MKILIADDSATMRMIIRLALHRAGLDEHDVHEVSDGKSAVEELSLWSPDLVLCDWYMPGMDGIDVLREARLRGSSAAFGFLTGESLPDVDRIASECGALFVLRKPFDGEALRQCLAPLLTA